MISYLLGYINYTITKQNSVCFYYTTNYFNMYVPVHVYVNIILVKSTNQCFSDIYVNLLKPTGTLAKVLDKQASHIKLPVLSNPSSSGKVITSKEN